MADSEDSSSPAEVREASQSRPEPRAGTAHFDRPPAAPRRPASTESVQGAIEQVNQIIETLRETLDEMEGVLESLELAERQKTADEQEIDSLRRSMRNLQRPRDERSSSRSPERPVRREDEPSESQ
jgi:predicted RNase H-like nuclease (RuvC/YqgF family)